ncbi:MAG: helix-turn-helix domain-containing protein [Phycisphaeraceae bacterium]|nr:helix-turn-helix domain-containing protein [Phycisphaeraceae bacterium]
MPTIQTSQVDPASASLLSIEQLADWLGLTDRFIRRLVAERRIPFLKIGKFIRFDPAEIEPWFDSQRVAER